MSNNNFDQESFEIQEKLLDYTSYKEGPKLDFVMCWFCSFQRLHIEHFLLIFRFVIRTKKSVAQTLKNFKVIRTHLIEKRGTEILALEKATTVRKKKINKFM